jgi:outer membrane protein TolC
MIKEMNMKMTKHIISTVLAAVLASLASFPALAASPEFSRSAEEWESLRDNVLEYDEIADLIHEYNATVRKNDIDLNEFRKDYGITNDEWSDKYRDLADDLESAIDYPDTDDVTYGTVMAQIISNQLQAKNYRETADDALEDYQVKYYDYQAAECNLVSAAQTSMINYYLNQLQLAQDQTKLELLQETYQNTVTKRDLGTATDVEVLLASENVRNQEKAIHDDESAIENTRQSLIVMLGWKNTDQPEITEIPEIDPDRIAAMDPAVDKEIAIENSYTMKSNQKKFENAETQDRRETLERTIRESKETIGANLTAAYQDVLAKQASYELSQTQAALEEKNLRTADRQYGLGSISHMQHLTQKITTETARINVETSKLNLFQSIQSYENMLNGSAG